MRIQDIVVEIDAEISRLQHVKALLPFAEGTGRLPAEFFGVRRFSAV
jgi:hypothetical protein